jgi:cytochrome c nitrite reductase small subunit
VLDTLLRRVYKESVQRFRLHVVLASLAGLVLGIGGFTFQYGEGLSYFSTDPRACANCHIMNDQYASWTKGPHHGAAVCTDCHLPHTFVAKYLAKADNGYRHSRGFTFQDFHEPIMITPRNARILQENCLNCHGDFVHDIVQGSKTAADTVHCVHCHRGVGHGARN